MPEYVIEDEGPDHMKTFTAQVRVGDQLYGNGIGRSKKEAEQGAAETAYGEIAAASAAAAAPTARRTDRRPARPAVPELPEVEVVRAGLERHVVGAHHRRASTYSIRDRSAATRAAPTGFAAALTGRRSTPPAGAASTSGCRSTTATPSSATSA